jgi:PPK2 family polyphosphate:nucleotide phosphotransferase
VKNEDVKKLVKPYRIRGGKGFRLKDIDPGDTHGLKSESKKETREWLQQNRQRLTHLQAKLYAQDRWALLVIIQGMDAAGKDSTIKHVMSGVNPQGCEVHSFKAPSSEELDHDYLWRAVKALPERGGIGIFNRSYYEEVLVVRVHSELLANEKIPDSLVTKKIWRERYKDINAFERYLTRNGVGIRKFFLHISQGEQTKRLLERLDDPDKNWKFSIGDVHEREYWSDYLDAYEEMIRHTSYKHAPWFVVPADNKWFSWMIVAAGIVDALEGMNLAFPRLDPAKLKELQEVRKAFGGASKSQRRKS